MSTNSWEAEFYTKRHRFTTPEEALAHSLQKWRGLLPENLAKHEISPGDLRYLNTFGCALCYHFMYVRGASGGRCSTCPLYAQQGNVCCDAATDPPTPWMNYCNIGDAVPVVAALEACAAAEKGGV